MCLSVTVFILQTSMSCDGLLGKVDFTPGDVPGVAASTNHAARVCSVSSEPRVAGVLRWSEVGPGRGAAPAALAGAFHSSLPWMHAGHPSARMSIISIKPGTACKRCSTRGRIPLLSAAVMSQYLQLRSLNPADIAVAAQESNHAGFPEDHQRAVRALLLCHHRLQAGGGHSQPASEGDATGSGQRFRRSTRLLQRVRPHYP